MAIGDIKTFDIVYSGLTLQINAIDLGGGKTTFEIKCISGSADINALYWGDNVADGNIFDLGTKKDNSLNMNGTGVDWDGGLKLSSTGLGTAGVNKTTYLTAGEHYDVLAADVSWDSLGTLGVRATSTSTAEGSIKGVDTGGTVTLAPQISVDDVTVTEGVDANAVFTVSLNHAYLYDITISYGTSNGSAQDVSDYTGIPSGTVTILAGQTSATVSVAIVNDSLPEPTETFNVNLTAATADIPGPDISVVISDNLGVGTILDDDTTPVNNGPVANDDAWIISNATQFDIPVAWLTWNDTDPDNDPVYVTAVDDVGGWHENYDGSGHLTHITVSSSNGHDPINFTYTLSDGTTTSTGNVTVQVIQTTGTNPQTVDLSAENYDHSYIYLNNGDDTETLGGAVINYAIGGEGQDTLIGLNGTVDRFVYPNEADSDASYHNNGDLQDDDRDTIVNFVSGEDKIDLSGLSALSSAGELTGTTIAANSFGWNTDGTFIDIYVNTSNSAQTITDGADYDVSMEIHLAGAPTIAATDFIHV
jgi:hypothetical protein